jgi:hypothetical protein
MIVVLCVKILGCQPLALARQRPASEASVLEAGSASNSKTVGRPFGGPKANRSHPALTA